MHSYKKALASSVTAAALLSFGGIAAADPVVLPAAGSDITAGPTTQNQEATAVNGPRQEDPYYQPKGIPIDGPFRLFPNLFGSLGYDDNVFRSDTGKASSVVFNADPTLVLDYDTSRARIDLYAQGGYQDYSQFDFWTYNAGLQGQYEISHAADVEFNVSDGLFYEALASANSSTAQKRPNEYYLTDASGKVTYKPNRLGFTVGGSFDAYAFTQTPGTNYFAFQRNATISKGWAEASYDFSPGYSAFIKGTYNSDDYSHLDEGFFTPFPPVVPPTPPFTDRSSHGFSVDGGVDLLLGDLAQGEAYLGYLTQDYNKSGFSNGVAVIPLHDISGFDYGANVTWYPTELLTLKLSGARQIQNTIVVGANAGDDKNVTLNADYEVLRRLHALANVAYDDINYNNTVAALNREDQQFTAGIGGKYLLSHYVWLNATYQYTIRSSNIPGAHFVDNLVTVGLNLQD